MIDRMWSRNGRSKRLGDMLLVYDNARRNSAALFGLALLWTIAAPCSKGPELPWLWFGPPGVLVLFSTGGFVWSRIARRWFEAVADRPLGAEEIGPLLRAMERKGGWATSSARGLLLQLLPVLREEDAGELSRWDQGWMQRYLRAAVPNPFLDVRLTLAFLAAQVEVGTPPVRPIVEEMAASAAYVELRDAAAAVLPAVRERTARAANTSTLLRPTERTGEPGAVLLRSARGKNGPVDTLVRPAGTRGDPS
jgi:hypothetical protein